MRELEVLKHIDHPFHIEFVESFIYQKKLCMITKYVNGGDLKALIYDKNKDKGFTEKEALMYLA